MADAATTITELGAYRIEATLGQGGMGEVFLAWDQRLRRHVAIKRIRRDKADEPHRQRFRREAQAVARLNHPAIVQIHDVVKIRGDDCIVMEYVEGRGLDEIVAGGALAIGDALRLALDVAEGLAEAHGKGLIHRDLKSANVRVTPDGRAKIVDFGIARQPSRLADASSEQLTASGALVGTFHAMSPEQASGRALDHRSDLFALGGLLYEMLTGRRPFQGTDRVDTLLRICSEIPTPIRELRPLDNTARIWNADNGRTIATLLGHTDGVRAASWSPDGSRVLTASADKTARIWAVSDHYPDYLRGRIRARTRHCLEPEFYQEHLGESGRGLTTGPPWGWRRAP